MAHLFYYCTACGLPLSNPVSQELGQGPVCRVGAKNRSMNQNSIFSDRASFTWGFLRPRKPKNKLSIIWIEDLDKGKTVTNDMSNVLQDIDRELKALQKKDSIDSYLLMYRDTRGVWDGVDLKPWSGLGERRLYIPTIFSLRNSLERMTAADVLWDIHLKETKLEEVEE